MRFKLTMRLTLLTVLLNVLPHAAFTQSPLGQKPPFGNSVPPEDPEREKLEKDMARKANQQRQAQLKRDSKTLLTLANELKENVDKSNENTLSLDVIKKAEQIEKLAHSIKERMRGYN